jgi:hypothetical protein
VPGPAPIAIEERMIESDRLGTPAGEHIAA